MHSIRRLGPLCCLVIFEFNLHSGRGLDADVAKSFLALMDLIELLHMSMRDAVDAARLDTLTQTCLKRFVKACHPQASSDASFGEVPEGLLREQKFIGSCFCHDGDHLHNTGPWFDRKILEELRQHRCRFFGAYMFFGIPHECIQAQETTLSLQALDPLRDAVCYFEPPLQRLLQMWVMSPRFLVAPLCSYFRCILHGWRRGLVRGSYGWSSQLWQS